MPAKTKDIKKKAKRVIKQKQKQQISIVINSNNRSKRGATPGVPKQGPQQPQEFPSRPPAVNLGNTRPQVTASSNFSGLGQQARIYSEDSALEQRLLTKLLNMKNDKSANPVPALSNEKILPYAPTVDPASIPPMYPPMHNYTQPRPAINVDYIRALQAEDNKLREAKQQQAQKTPQNESNEPTKPQSMTDKFIGYFRPKVTPFPSVGSTETPNRLTDIHAEENEENDEESKADGYEIDDEGVEVSPIRPLNLEAEERRHVKKTKAGKTQWKAQRKEYKLGLGL